VATGGLAEAREERAGLDRCVAELERDAGIVRNELAERDVAHPPAWARETFGERPVAPGAAEQWDRGVRAIARHRIENDVPDQVAGLGPEPDAPHALSSWREADQKMRLVQRRLGLSIDRERGRDIGFER
jgi:hypothetical protein